MTNYLCMKPVHIEIITRPSVLLNTAPWFVLQAFEHVKVIAQKINNKTVVAKKEIVQKIKARGFAFSSAADFIEKIPEEQFELKKGEYKKT